MWLVLLHRSCRRAGALRGVVYPEQAARRLFFSGPRISISSPRKQRFPFPPSLKAEQQGLVNHWAAQRLVVKGQTWRGLSERKIKYRHHLASHSSDAAFFSFIGFYPTALDNCLCGCEKFNPFILRTLKRNADWTAVWTAKRLRVSVSKECNND